MNIVIYINKEGHCFLSRFCSFSCWEVGGGGGRSKVGRTQGSALHVIGHRVIVDVVGGG